MNVTLMNFTHTSQLVPAIDWPHLTLQEPFSDDLSLALRMFNHKIRLLVCRDQPAQSLTHLSKQSETDKILTKYREFPITTIFNLKAFQRFSLRVKEVIRSLVLPFLKNKSKLNETLKQIDSFSVIAMKDFNSKTIGQLLHTVLVDIPKDISNVLLKHDLTDALIAIGIQSNTQQCIRVMTEHSKKEKLKSQNLQENHLQILFRQLKIIDILNIDQQHYRKTYFDLQTNQNARVLFMDCVLRNKHVNDSIQSYQKDLSSCKNQTYQCSDTVKPKTSDVARTMSFNSQIATIVNFHSEKKSLFSEESYKKFREKHCRSDFKKNAAAFAQLGYMNIPSIENAEAVSDNYKTMAFKNRIWEKIARPIEMKSVLISPIPKYSQNYEAITLRRKQFYRRTQEHLKLRYKYVSKNVLSQRQPNKRSPPQPSLSLLGDSQRAARIFIK